MSSRTTERTPQALEIGQAAIRISVKDVSLERRLVQSIQAAVGSRRRIVMAEPVDMPVVRFRTSARLAKIESDGLRGALAIIRVTRENLRRLGTFVDRAKLAGALGVQLVWDGETPSRECAERHVFDVLEGARAKPEAPPVLLTRTAAPHESLRMMGQHRARLRRAASPEVEV